MFTLLTAGFCAVLGTHGTQNVVGIGYVSSNECIVHLITPAEGMFRMGGYDFEIRHLEHGAAVRIDSGPEVVLIETDPA